jgi:hypothetical protein
MRRALATLMLLASAVTPALARDPLVCIAPTAPADAGRPLAEVKELEFYADEGDPLKSFSRQFVLKGAASDPQGRTRNLYAVGPEQGDGTIVFADSMPVSFSIAATKQDFVSLKRNDEESASMADAVPGVICYTVGPAGSQP